MDRCHETCCWVLGLASTRSRTWLWLFLGPHWQRVWRQGHLSLRKQHLVMLVRIASDCQIGRVQHIHLAQRVNDRRPGSQ